MAMQKQPAEWAVFCAVPEFPAAQSMLAWRWLCEDFGAKPRRTGMRAGQTTKEIRRERCCEVVCAPAGR